MVDITRCEACGRVIPATEDGCPYCEREREGREEVPYLPLALRLLWILFLADVVGLGTLGALVLLRGIGQGGPLVLWLGGLRLSLCLLTLVALVVRRPWGRFVPLGLIGVELTLGALVHLGHVPARAWSGGMLPALWTVLFLLLFLRADIQGRFDRRVLDRHEVGELIRTVQKGRSR